MTKGHSYYMIKINYLHHELSTHLFCSQMVGLKTPLHPISSFLAGAHQCRLQYRVWKHSKRRGTRKALYLKQNLKDFIYKAQRIAFVNNLFWKMLLFSPVTDDILTIRPCAFRIRGRNVLVILIMPIKFTSNTSRKTFSDVISNSDTYQIPALFTSPQRPTSY